MTTSIKLQQRITLKQGFLLQKDSVSPVVIKRGILQHNQTSPWSASPAIFAKNAVK
jgi:hypothetical protein